MVKKIKADGNPCTKCLQVEDLLRERGYHDRIDRFVYAEENNPLSEGYQLAEKFKVDVAPFFIVEKENTEPVIYKSVLAMINQLFTPQDTRTGSAAMPTLEELQQKVRPGNPQDTVNLALQVFGRDCRIAFSGAEDVVLIDMAVRSGYGFTVFCLDTGRLFPETYAYLEAVRKHYQIEIRVYSPDPAELEPFVREKGLYSFREDGHQECCGIRKVSPLKRALAECRAWMSGQRKDQSPATRNSLDTVLADPLFKGSGGDTLIKFNPLADWTSQQVWDYIRENGIPYNPLHERGFISIGCEPCTRATLPGEHERAGRWWWEAATKRECGLHVSHGDSNPELTVRKYNEK